MSAAASSRSSAKPSGDLRALAIVPARLASQRLPRKMLLRRTGQYLFAHTARAVQRCPEITRVVVAVDSEEVMAAAHESDLEAVMTRPDHPSGTDRVFGALRALGGTWDVVLNVQGDEPGIDPDDLGRLVRAFRDPAVETATLAAPIATEEEASSSSVVKVVCDRAGDALYFSRARIPGLGHARPASAGLGALRRHIGAYAFRPPALERFCALPRGRLEEVESLEQLRWLEDGRKMRVVEASRAPSGIDTAEDYERFVGAQAAAKGGRT